MFPLLYQAHYRRHQEDIPFWLTLAQEQGGPMLELGCGAGRVLLALAQAGLEAWGLDQDFGMLSVLRQAAPSSLSGQYYVWQAEMDAFHVAARFPLIIVPCNTYSTLSASERLAVASCVRQHLAPGGRFAFAVPNPALLRSIPHAGVEEIEESFPHPQDGMPVQVSSAWQRSPDFFTITWHYDHLLPGGEVDRLQVETRHHLASRSQYLDELREAGFNQFQLYGSFHRSPFKPRSDLLIAVAF
jgi:SAM-dependent methyltransferase